jgi:hypothetical protein
MAIAEVVHSTLEERDIELLVVATPVGPLAHAIDAYRQAVAVRIGINPAHRSPPHCLLTRSYHDQRTSARSFRRALVATLRSQQRPLRGVATALTTNREWHGLEFESPSLTALAVEIATGGTSATRHEHVLAHSLLRLALATDFDAADHHLLSELAHRIVDPALPAEWRVELWQCSDGLRRCALREHVS